MSDVWEPRKPKYSTHFKFFAEKYLWGGTRHELEPDERSVWLDFLCLATVNFGDVIIFSRESIASLLVISSELLDRSIKKFIKYKKVSRKYSKKEKKEIFTIIKWSKYQTGFLTDNPEKSGIDQKKERSGKKGESDAEITPTLHKTTENNITSNNNNMKQIEFTDFSDSSPSVEVISVDIEQSSSTSSADSEEEEGLKEEFLTRLKNCPGYPFDEKIDSDHFDFCFKKYPAANWPKMLNIAIKSWTNDPELIDTHG